MTFVPYSCQTILDEDIEAVSEVLRSDYLTQGPAVPRFEDEFSRVHKVAHAVAVSNATAGLHIACVALGVKQGSRVWTSPNSFLASANCALYCGAEIDFVDIDPETRNMSVTSLRSKLADASAHGRLPDVVIPVHFSGLPCDLREIRVLADQYGFRILEDASHATGAQYLGEPIGSQFADASVFSFHAVKIVTTAEGGLVATRSEELAKRLRLLRSHGITRDRQALHCNQEGDWYYEQHVLGFNYRLTDMQAALGSAQLRRLPQLHAARERAAARYDALLADFPLILPRRLSDRQSSWHLYVVEIDGERTTRRRAEVFQRLRKVGVGVNVHYIPIHTQPYYQMLGFRHGDFPASEKYYSNALSLPLFPRLVERDQDLVVDALASILRGA